jgi:hypothetical protein
LLDVKPTPAAPEMPDLRGNPAMPQHQ